ncbi:thymidine phosphorylase [Roseivivax sp. CAU 1761]
MSAAQEVLAALRRGAAPAPEALAGFARGLATGAVSDAQAGAFAMAVCLRGLSGEGRAALTLAMRDSGRVLDWPEGAPVLDKHSTGGIGDCTSLVIAPALAACGARVPMISGRGLGHTGGTLDKLEAIPGLSTQVDEARLREIVAATGCAIVGATADIAPADRRLYAVRDVTATVDSIDLITASILSKKLAAGLGGLVLDVKTGSGAFMSDPDAARQLAEVLVATACAAGCPTRALITDMDAPLAPVLGNALEVAEALAVLRSAAWGRLGELSAALGGTVLAQAGMAGDEDEGRAAIAAAIRDGRAAERFGAMVAALGGPGDLMDRADRLLPRAPVIRPVPAPEDGHVAAIDGVALGRAVVALGGGRQVESDRIDPAVGLARVAAPGSAVARGDPLAEVHAATPEAAAAAIAAVTAAIRIGAAPEALPLIRGRVG